MSILHEMKLQEGPFNKIKQGSKTIEMRLYDEKRRKISKGDKISFTNIVTNEIIYTEVINLYLFDSFAELYKNFNKIEIGYEKNDVADSKDMEQYYSKEEMEQYGVVGIEIKLIDRW